MYRKISVITGTFFLIIVLFLYHESFLYWIQNTEQDHLFLTTVIATFMSFFPVIPYPVVGGVIGAAYGPTIGALIIWAGSTLASFLFFSLIRYGGFQAFGTKVLLKYAATKKLTLLFEQNAFMSVTIMRMIPVIPSIIINAYAALSRVPFVLYAIASALGKIPSMMLFAIAGHTIVTNPIDLFYMIAGYGAFLAIIYLFYKTWLGKVEKSKTDPNRA
ncbi:TVP38/TMEM64 family protein [Salipaludibacillus neizhouensis]|uniref:TVP38/TMEM64 family membrane protein n=1 Tax=Salipaludibacillus neizhouensis TaxID=885475 RepID=A0A3A9KEU6_9BACI|nr:VTT domain-containing protein [Salipaludibacillus neizhouensis]RKL69170.1 TVP38/TMEM64 family protein [Salipaludibacillus neizhouensis]